MILTAENFARVYGVFEAGATEESRRRSENEAAKTHDRNHHGNNGMDCCENSGPNHGLVRALPGAGFILVTC